jgi:hypothetical protein
MVPLEKRIAGGEAVGAHKTSMLQDVSPDASSGGPLAPARVGARLNVTGGAR